MQTLALLALLGAFVAFMYVRRLRAVDVQGNKSRSAF